MCDLFVVCRKGWIGVGYVCCTWDKFAVCRVFVCKFVCRVKEGLDRCRACLLYVG